MTNKIPRLCYYCYIGVVVVAGGGSATAAGVAAVAADDEGDNDNDDDDDDKRWWIDDVNVHNDHCQWSLVVLVLVTINFTFNL